MAFLQEAFSGEKELADVVSVTAFVQNFPNVIEGYSHDQD